MGKTTTNPLGFLREDEQEKILRTIFHPKEYQKASGITPQYQYGSNTSPRSPPPYICTNCHIEDERHSEYLKLMMAVIKKYTKHAEKTNKVKCPKCNHEISQNPRLIFKRSSRGTYVIFFIKLTTIFP